VRAEPAFREILENRERIFLKKRGVKISVFKKTATTHRAMLDSAVTNRLHSVPGRCGRGVRVGQPVSPTRSRNRIHQNPPHPPRVHTFPTVSSDLQSFPKKIFLSKKNLLDRDFRPWYDIGRASHTPLDHRNRGWDSDGEDGVNRGRALASGEGSGRGHTSAPNVRSKPASHDSNPHHPTTRQSPEPTARTPAIDVTDH